MKRCEIFTWNKILEERKTWNRTSSGGKRKCTVMWVFWGSFKLSKRESEVDFRRVLRKFNVLFILPGRKIVKTEVRNFSFSCSLRCLDHWIHGVFLLITLVWQDTSTNWTTSLINHVVLSFQLLFFPFVEGSKLFVQKSRRLHKCDTRKTQPRNWNI